MKTYEKPMIIKVEDVAESVYMASGTAGGGSTEDGISYIVSLTKPGNEYNKVNKYEVIIYNHSGSDASDWKVELTVTGSATSAQSYNGWMANANLNGNKITITPGGGGKIEAGKDLKVEVVVSYNSAITVS